MTTAISDHEYQFILEEDAIRRLAAERRFRVPGCPWGCDGSGFHEIALSEYGPLDAIAEPEVVVLPWMLLFACECNSAGGRVRRGLGWMAS